MERQLRYISWKEVESGSGGASREKEEQQGTYLVVRVRVGLSDKVKEGKNFPRAFFPFEICRSPIPMR